MNAIPLMTRGYICPPSSTTGRTLDKGPKVVRVKDLKPEIRAAKTVREPGDC